MNWYFRYLTFLLFPLYSSAQTINTVAGNGTTNYGGDGGPAVNAGLSGPSDVARDTSGNFYISDRYHNMIRKVNTLGIITTIGGTGVAGNTGDGGPATLAEINQPIGIATDSKGNIYFTVYNTVRKINAYGIISTIAGNGTSGYSGDGGPATLAMLNEPIGVATDPVGNVYIADWQAHVVRKVDTNGIITTLAGTGVGGYNGDNIQATTAQLWEPWDVNVAQDRTVYIADSRNNRIRKVDVNGVITTYAGTGTGGFNGDNIPAINAELWRPRGVATTPNNEQVYISDGVNNRVRVVDGSIINTVAGTGVQGFSGDGGPALLAQLAIAGGGGMDASDPYNAIYIADGANQRIRKLCNGTNAIVTMTAAQGDTLCTGNIASFHAQVTNAGNQPLFQWYVNGSPVATNVLDYSYTPADGDTVYCLLNSNDVCVNNANASSDTFVLAVLDTVPPQVSITANPGVNIGIGQQVVFTATALNAGPNPGYQWMKNGTDLPGQTLQTYTTNTLAESDHIGCRVHSLLTCAYPDTASSNLLTIHITTGIGNVAGTPQVSLSPNPCHGSFTISLQQVASLSIANLQGQAIAHYRLSKGDTQVQLPASLAAGVYILTVTDGQGSKKVEKLMVQ